VSWIEGSELSGFHIRKASSTVLQGFSKILFAVHRADQANWFHTQQLLW